MREEARHVMIGGSMGQPRNTASRLLWTFISDQMDQQRPEDTTMSFLNKFLKTLSVGQWPTPKQDSVSKI